MPTDITTSLTLGRPDWLPIVVAIAVCLLIILVWSYRRSSLSPTWRVIAMSLKALGILLMLSCLLQPMWRQTRPKPQANRFLVLADDSRSMGLPVRGQLVRDVLSEEASWLQELSRVFDVRQYQFDTQLSQRETHDPLELQGAGTSLVRSLEQLGERFRDQPVAGIVLVSDGNETVAADDSKTQVERYDLPIYPIDVDDKSAWADLKVADLSVSQTNFEASPVTIQGRVAGKSVSGGEVVVMLQDESGETVEEQTLSLDSSDTSQPFRFQFRPKESGVQFYRVSAVLTDDRQVFDQAMVEGKDLATVESERELTLENNVQTLVVDRRQGPFRVLYVAGRPNWEFKFLRRALASSAEVELIGLLRIANKEPKFSFRSKGASGSNPLFAGLGDDEEETREQYDQPVMVRLGVKDSEELSDGFPKSADELFAYHGVILDDLDAEFFTQDQMLLLRQFVSVRGGGVLMLGGTESFDASSFAKTPLGDLSPVYLKSSRLQRDEPESSEATFSLTREGLLQPWVRLKQDSASEAKRLAEMPAFRTLNPVAKIKPGALELGRVRSASGRADFGQNGAGPSGTDPNGAEQGRAGQGSGRPALVTQRFGRGRTAALMIGDFWRWSMRVTDANQDQPPQAWRQIVRWMVGEVPGRVDVEIEPLDQAGSRVNVLVNVDDATFAPEENAAVELTLESGQDEPLTLQARPHESQLGVYQATLRGRQVGGHRVTASVTTADGESLPSSTAGWVYEPARRELERLETNQSFLQTLADRSGGEVISASKLNEFVDSLSRKDVDVMETNLIPLWHRPWMMLAAILCLCGEWGIRRMKGLA